MRIGVFFMVFLTLSAATIATVSIASNISLPVLTGHMQSVMFDTDFNEVKPNGDPVPGGGKGPG